jgi:hypothetical protein
MAIHEVPKEFARRIEACRDGKLSKDEQTVLFADLAAYEEELDHEESEGSQNADV